jgi:hypothetical protein
MPLSEKLEKKITGMPVEDGTTTDDNSPSRLNGADSGVTTGALQLMPVQLIIFALSDEAS